MFTDPIKWQKPIENEFHLSLFNYSINKYKFQLIKLKNFKAEQFENMQKEKTLY